MGSKGKKMWFVLRFCCNRLLGLSPPLTLLTAWDWADYPTASYWVVFFEVKRVMFAKWPQFSTKTRLVSYLQETNAVKFMGNSHDISNLNRTRGHGRSMEVYKQKTGHDRNGVRWKDMKVTMTLSPSHIVNECIWDKERNRSKFGTSSPIVSHKTIYIHSWSAFHSSFLCDGEQGTAQTCSNGCRSAWDLDYLDLRYWEEVDMTYRTNTMSSTAHNNESHMHLNPGRRLQFVF